MFCQINQPRQNPFKKLYFCKKTKKTLKLDVVAADAGPLFIIPKSKLVLVDILAMAMNKQTSRVVDLITLLFRKMPEH